jgi:hypothetical protein
LGDVADADDRNDLLIARNLLEIVACPENPAYRPVRQFFIDSARTDSPDLSEHIPENCQGSIFFHKSALFLPIDLAGFRSLAIPMNGSKTKIFLGRGPAARSPAF